MAGEWFLLWGEMRKLLKVAVAITTILVLAGVGSVLWFDYTYQPSEVVEYARVGDTALELNIFESPGDDSSAKRPAVLLFHGGGWRSGLPAQMFHTAVFLAEHGYVAAAASYRLKYSDGATPFDCVDDAKAAYRWLWDNADRFDIDRQRIAVGGSSAGGHLAAAVALLARPSDPPDPPAAMLLYNAAVDTAFETPTEARLQMIADEFGERGKDISPTHHIRAGAPPAIVFHGMQDGMVPFEHARTFCDRMAEMGNTCELVAYPDAGHGFYNIGLPLVDDANAKLLAFLEQQGITSGTN